MFFFDTKYFTGILYKEVEITGIRGTVLHPVPMIQRERAEGLQIQMHSLIWWNHIDHSDGLRFWIIDNCNELIGLAHHVRQEKQKFIPQNLTEIDQQRLWFL